LSRTLKTLVGFAPHFRPTYAGANVGHPSYSFELCYDKHSEGTAESKWSFHADTEAVPFVQELPADY